MHEQGLKKEASLKGLLALGLGGAGGYAALSHGSEFMDALGQGFTKHIYDPAYRIANPIITHVGEHAGKYLGTGLSLAALLATKGKVKSMIPQLATSATALGAGTWWDNSRRQAALDKILWENKLKADQESWREAEDVEDPYALPSAPPAFGETGWRPSDGPTVNLTPSP